MPLLSRWEIEAEEAKQLPAPEPEMHLLPDSEHEKKNPS
jgi:hypothetical protein